MNLHVPVVEAVQQITNELFVFPTKTYNSISIFHLFFKVLSVLSLPGVNVLDRLAVLELLPLQTLGCFFLWRNGLLGNGISSSHKLFGHIAALTRDLKG